MKRIDIILIVFLIGSFVQVLCVSETVLVPPAPEGFVPASSIPTTAAPAIPTPTPAEEDDEDIPYDQLPFCDELE